MHLHFAMALLDLLRSALLRIAVKLLRLLTALTFVTHFDPPKL
jgi:hypothetical protein